MERISAVLLTRDEEANIQRCLDSLAWVDEIVVVDTGSTDNTLAIAEPMVHCIVHGDMRKGFAYNRNLGNRKASHPWILKIDADEVVPAGLAEEIRDALREDPDVDGYLAATRAFFHGKWIRGCGWYPMYQVRVFRKKNAYWEGLVHERLVLDGRTSHLTHDVLHYSYDDIQHYFHKFNLYTSLEARRMVEEGRRIFWWNVPGHFLVRPMMFFLKTYGLQRGWKDGFYGFLVSLYSSFYVGVKYMKLYEIQKDSGANVPLN